MRKVLELEARKRRHKAALYNAVDSKQATWHNRGRLGHQCGFDWVLPVLQAGEAGGLFRSARHVRAWQRGVVGTDRAMCTTPDAPEDVSAWVLRNPKRMPKSEFSS